MGNGACRPGPDSGPIDDGAGDISERPEQSGVTD